MFDRLYQPLAHDDITSTNAWSDLQAEMDIYCPLVSVGCYCIVEDTRMNRWSTGGPLEAVKAFLKKNSDFFMVNPVLCFLLVHFSVYQNFVFHC